MSSLKDSQCASHSYLGFVTSQNISMEANMSRSCRLEPQIPASSKALCHSFVVFKQTHYNACIFECVMLCAIHSPQMLVGCGTFDAIQQHSQIITFTRCWVCIIHATNGKASLAHCPSLQLPIPHPLLRKLIKRKASCSFRFLVCFEPFRQHRSGNG
jgi:hypothetical protein